MRDPRTSATSTASCVVHCQRAMAFSVREAWRWGGRGFSLEAGPSCLSPERRGQSGADWWACLFGSCFGEGVCGLCHVQRLHPPPSLLVCFSIVLQHLPSSWLSSQSHPPPSPGTPSLLSDHWVQRSQKGNPLVQFHPRPTLVVFFTTVELSVTGNLKCKCQGLISLENSE